MGRILAPVMFLTQPHFRRTPIRNMACQQRQANPVDDLIKLFFNPFFSKEEAACCGDVEKCQRSTEDVIRKKPWLHVMSVRGYAPGEIEVKVGDGKVHVHAHHEVRDGDNVDSYQTKRVIELPADVDPEKLASFLTSDDKLIVKAPRLEQEKRDVAETSGREMKKGEREVKSQSSETGETDKPDTLEEKTDVQEKDNSSLPAHVDDKESETKLTGDDFIIPDDIDNTQKHPEVQIPSNPGLNLTISLNKTDTSVDEIEEKSVQDDETEVLGQTPPHGSPLSLSVLGDSTQIIEEEDGKKEFQVRINLADFDDEDLSIRSDDSAVFIDGVKTWERDGMRGTQEVHRQFTVPGAAIMGGAKALRDGSGVVTVTVPLETVTDKNDREIPIQHS